MVVTILQEVDEVVVDLPVPGKYSIEVTNEDNKKYRPLLFKSGELVWSGATGYESPDQARNAAIREYHIDSGDLQGISETQVISIDPSLLIPHPKNAVVYAGDEETAKLKEMIEGANPPYISEFIITPEGVIISGNRRHFVISQINQERLEVGESNLIKSVPAIVRSYANEAEELEALVLENYYRENKSEETILREALTLLQAQKEKARQRQSQAKAEGGVPEEEQGRSIQIVGKKMGVAPGGLRKKLEVTTGFIDQIEGCLEGHPSEDQAPTLKRLLSKVRNKSTKAAVELWKLWESDSDRGDIDVESYIRACEILLAQRTSAKKALAQGRKEVKEIRQRERERETRSGLLSDRGESKKGKSGSTPPTPRPKDNTSVVDASDVPVDNNGVTEEATQKITEEAELEELPDDDRRVWWQEASDEQRQKWRDAKAARDIYGDIPSNNRMTPIGVVERCLDVIGCSEFDYDPFADLTNPGHIPAKNYYTVKDDFFKKDKGEYVNAIAGNVFANILWNQQRDCMGALCHWIDRGTVDTMFIVSQASILNLPSCQELIKKHGFVVMSWSGRLEYDAGGILSYDCMFPLDGKEPRKIPTGNQRYDTVILFYAKDRNDRKLKCSDVFGDFALVSYQKEDIITSEIEAEDTIQMPVWVGGECVWYGYEMTYQIDDNGIFSVTIAKNGQSIDESGDIEAESFVSEESAKAYAISRVLLLLAEI